MKVSNILNCSFAEWYPKFAKDTFPSITIHLPQSFIQYLNTDGLVLPESSTHGISSKSENLAMDGDEDDPDIRDDDLMKMYEADWSVPSQVDVAESPDFGDFDKEVSAAIKSLGGRVFPKLNWSAPKDASWISFDKTLMCTCPSDIYLLLKSSDFIAHDTDQPFIQCEDFDEAAASKVPVVEYSLILRKWEPPDPSTEFRCFVHDERIIAVCQRNSTKFYPHIFQEKMDIVEDIQKFFKEKICNKFADTAFVFDVIRRKEGKIILVDFNPFGEVTDTILFTWEEIHGFAQKSLDELPCFRCVEEEGGVKSSDYANYALPLDIQDLVAGEDPYKFLDLMKMKIQKGNGDDSSTEDEEERTKRSGDGGSITEKETTKLENTEPDVESTSSANDGVMR